MNAITTEQAWLAILVVTAAETLIFGGWALHMRGVIKGILKDERQKLHAATLLEAERRARKRVREILSTVRFQVGVQLINESDIPWGRSEIKQTGQTLPREQHKEDAA